MKAHAVIGANYGDEGKGLMTDYLCARKGAGVVVRFNGGAQAGHTVTTPDGKRHVFHHFGSGSFLGVPTFLSRFFVVNPILFCEELFGKTLPAEAKVIVDPRALVTTPLDMLVNQAKQNGHNTCGVGINETMQRSFIKQCKITVATILDRDLYRRAVYHARDRMGRNRLPPADEAHWEDVYFAHARRFLDNVEIAEAPPRCDYAVFEGAQGLMLDQDSPDFPYVTHSHTGLHNVRILCEELGAILHHATYVTRAYLTRHGDGPLPGEQPLPSFVQDATNINNKHQGPLRYAPLSLEAALQLSKRVAADAGDIHHDVAVTCIDQTEYLPPLLSIHYTAFGPARCRVCTKGE